MEEENSKKKRLKLDWKEVLDQNDDEPPTLMIVKTTPEPPKPSPMTTDLSSRDDCSYMTDHQLKEAIKRHKAHITSLSSNLPDNGEKLRTTLKAYEEELDRRKLRCSDMDVDVCEKPTRTHLMSSDEFKRENTSSEVRSQSDFASFFSRKMDENRNDSKVGKVFDKELSILGRCDRQKMRFNGNSSQRGRQKDYSSSRQLPFKCASSLSHNGDKYSLDNSDQKGTSSSTYLFHYNGQNLCSSFSEKKDSRQVLPSNGSRPRKGQTVVLLDEDETQHVEVTEDANKIAERMKDAKIDYPSRDDPESVEIYYKDINCLAPEGFLTSPIMNFYIRYLQISPTNKATCDYHFFNTFFYQKLKQAVSYKGSDKESFFIKFRRWWKGVNIFQKAYVFIPIHDDLHWSLVIICIPDKEDESGPIILHLDSLGLHSSKLVFEEIRSYLREEWNYMNQEVPPPKLPIADRIWKHLPRRIDEKKIEAVSLCSCSSKFLCEISKPEVPQQKNDYDCGLFVLFFMERFIEEAPDRLKKKDLAMFGKRWFRPEQASGLRVKIRKLLWDEFEKASPDGRISESSSQPSGGASP